MTAEHPLRVWPLLVGCWPWRRDRTEHTHTHTNELQPRGRHRGRTLENALRLKKRGAIYQRNAWRGGSDASFVRRSIVGELLVLVCVFARVSVGAFLFFHLPLLPAQTKLHSAKCRSWWERKESTQKLPLGTRNYPLNTHKRKHIRVRSHEEQLDRAPTLYLSHTGVSTRAQPRSAQRQRCQFAFEGDAVRGRKRRGHPSATRFHRARQLQFLGAFTSPRFTSMAHACEWHQKKNPDERRKYKKQLHRGGRKITPQKKKNKVTSTPHRSEVEKNKYTAS